MVAAGAGHTQVVEYFLEIDQEMNPDTLNFVSSQNYNK